MPSRARDQWGDIGDGIEELIIRRERARQAKNWGSADALRDQLEKLGVTLFDKTCSWRASDGRSGRLPSFDDIENGTAMAQLMSASATPASTGGSKYIKQLVQQREQARSNKDFDQSDRIREELKGMGVEVYDKEKMWRSKDGRSGIIVGFLQEGPSDTEVNTLVAQREKARKIGDFTTSDMIRDELKEHGVEVYDKEKQVRTADGRTAMVPDWRRLSDGSVSTPMGGGGMGGKGGMGGMGGMGNMGGMGGGMSGSDIQTKLLQAALQAAKDPTKAAQALQQLQGIGIGGGAGGKGGQSNKGSWPSDNVWEAQQAAKKGFGKGGSSSGKLEVLKHLFQKQSWAGGGDSWAGGGGGGKGGSSSGSDSWGDKVGALLAVLKMKGGGAKGSGKGSSLGKGWNSGKGGKQGNQGHPKYNKSLRVCVTGLHDSTTWKELQDHMEKTSGKRSKWVEVYGGPGNFAGAVVYNSAEEAAEVVGTVNYSRLKGACLYCDMWEMNGDPNFEFA